MYRHWAAYYLKSSLDRFSSLYLTGLRIKHRGRGFLKRIVSPATDICIEGHNRSANSFAVKAFRGANDSPEKEHVIATHVHASAQVRRAVDLGIPTMVLIREPKATVMSQKALAIQLKQVANPEAYPMEIFLAMYVDFHERLLPYKDGYMVASFEQVTKDFGCVMERFNDRFETDFNGIDHTLEKEADIFQQSRVHLSPSPERQTIKGQLDAEMGELEASGYMKDACRVYKEFSALAEKSYDGFTF